MKLVVFEAGTKLLHNQNYHWLVYYPSTAIKWHISLFLFPCEHVVWTAIQSSWKYFIDREIQIKGIQTLEQLAVAMSLDMFKYLLLP